jgi:hypothetical protein
LILLQTPVFFYRRSSTSTIFGFAVGFPIRQYSANFWDKGTEVPSLSRDKGTMGQTKNLAKGQDEPEKPKFGMGWTGIAKLWDGTWDKTGQSRKECSKTGK